MKMNEDFGHIISNKFNTLKATRDITGGLVLPGQCCPAVGRLRTWNNKYNNEYISF